MSSLRVAAAALEPEAPASTASRVFSSTVFPGVMILGVAGAMLLLDHGVAPRFINPIIVPPLFVLMTLLERFFPYRRAWNRSHGDLGVDIGYFFVTSFVVLVVTSLLTLVLIPAAAWLSNHTPFPVWPRSWPLFFQVLLALALAEFGHYWVHRLQHETPRLWRFHAVHHSAPRLYWLNAARFHPVDMMASGVAGFTPLLLLGCPEIVLVLFTLIGTIHNVFQHANIELRCGPLNYVFSMAELHRFHHSKNIEEGNSNYGGHLILWDLVFGTRYLPKDHLPPDDIGLFNQPSFPTALWPQLTQAFGPDRTGATEERSQAINESATHH